MKLGIRYKILFGFTLVLVLSYSIQVVGFSLAEKYIRLQTLNLQLEKAQNAVDQIENFISKVELDHLGIAQEFLQLPTGKYPDQAVEVTRYILKQNQFFKRIAILLPTGREAFKIDKFGETPRELLSFEIPTQPFEQAVNGQTGISKVYFLENSIPYLDIYTPIISDTQGMTIGVVKSQLQLDRLGDLIAQVRLGNEGFSYLVDDEGRLIAHPDFNLVLQGPNLSSRGLVQVLLKDDLDLLTASDYLYNNEQGIKVTANGLKIPRLGWVVIVEQPVTEAFQALTVLRTLFYATMVGSLVLLIIISLIISDNFTKPIQQLRKVAELLQQGRLDTRATIRSGDEIEELAKTFNLMADNLRESIFDLKQEKEVVEAERNKLQVVLGEITDGVVAVDLHRSVILFNSAAEKITGWTAKEVMGKSIDEVFSLFDQDDRIPVEVYFPSREEGFEGVVFSKNAIKMVTSYRVAYVNIIVGQIKESYQANLGGIITFHDVTHEQELERMKLDFVSIAAHELRTPLTTILGYLSFLQQPRSKDKLLPQEQEFLNRAALSATRLNKLIEDLLTVSKIEQAEITLNREPLQIEAIIGKVVMEMEGLAQPKNLKLLFDQADDQLPKVWVDASRIEEVLTNLIGNAINYTKEGRVVVTAVQDQQMVVITVEDTGQGIPAEAIPHLFTKFFRVQGEVQSGSKGTGLGLYVSQKIVNVHGGSIWVESEPGKGSRFSFSLPVAG